MRKIKFSVTASFLAAAIVLLIAANLILGLILMHQSRVSMQALMQARMLDISNTAANMLDGDKLKNLKKEDEGTPDYNEALDTLRAFLNSIELQYIYGIKDEGNNRFTFTIDPEEVDPGEFGEEVECTDALILASLGTAAVDETPYEDRWGRFYSAYSPVFDSEGNVAGIVAVDFSAAWYEDRIKNQLIAVIIVCFSSTMIGILMAFAVSAKIRSRFSDIYGEMNSLAHDLEDLNKSILTDSGGTVMTGGERNDMNISAALKSEGEKDEIVILGKKIRSMQKDLRQYIAYVNDQAFTDAMTGVGNKTAYLNRIKALDKLIAEKNADFSVAVFDINGLKTVNDNYGHEMGDKFIIGAAEAIKSIFGVSDVYRIGGDEFIAVLEQTTPESIEASFNAVDEITEKYNRGKKYPIDLSISKGAAAFSAEHDNNYNNVFKAADDAMYRCKSDYYKRKGNN